VEEPDKYMPPDWAEMYRLELGVDPSDQHRLLTAVTKDIVAARQGDPAAKRRVAAYYRAQRTLEKQPEAEEREVAEEDPADET
jgi:hypothetical protein